jgi:hypothetical protein
MLKKLLVNLFISTNRKGQSDIDEAVHESTKRRHSCVTAASQRQDDVDDGKRALRAVVCNVVLVTVARVRITAKFRITAKVRLTAKVWITAKVRLTTKFRITAKVWITAKVRITAGKVWSRKSRAGPDRRPWPEVRLVAASTFESAVEVVQVVVGLTALLLLPVSGAFDDVGKN